MTDRLNIHRLTTETRNPQCHLLCFFDYYFKLIDCQIHFIVLTIAFVNFSKMKFISLCFSNI